ncbi:dienelactone hydrolase family protein [Acidobacterium sp. S8]|uniref:dienelactone hydrolase family protein n=1 Tax=Acidobacterium sp. S8 TaxID=1641854 RepID=UPI00131C5C89|nr:dienelactone hydrolase family protein [Acidobacterium sp. S8]
MVLKDDLVVDIPTATGPMRTYFFHPAAEGRYPGVILYSEIFQLTGPIRRFASFIAGHGYVVAVPEVYHELEPAGTVLAYDQAGADKGNDDKYAKELASYDADARALIEYLPTMKQCNGRLGAIGICLGGHLAFRAAMNPEIRAAACFYATDIHCGTLGKGKNDDSLKRAEEIKGELLHIWGRQDPHVPLDGRMKIKARLDEASANYQWFEVNGAHAFMRDEGYRYDPELEYQCKGLVLSLLHRQLT